MLEVLGRKTGYNNNDIYFESDFFDSTGGDENLQSLRKWLAQLPHQKAERRQIGTEAIEKEVLSAISDIVNKLKEAPLKKITMQVKPHLLFTPELSLTTAKAPDTIANYQLFDRVVVAKETDKFAVGLKGTVVGISKVKDLNPVRQECVNKEDVYCDIHFDNPIGGLETGRLPIENLINISYGESIAQTNTDPKGTPSKARYVEPQKTRENVNRKTGGGPSFAQILQNPVRPEGEKLNKRQDFAAMWNELKKVGEPTQTNGFSKQPSPPLNGNLNTMMKDIALSKQVPSIIAPTQLPQPPVAWLSNVAMKVQLENSNLPIQSRQATPPFAPNPNQHFVNGNQVNQYHYQPFFPNNNGQNVSSQ